MQSKKQIVVEDLIKKFLREVVSEQIAANMSAKVASTSFNPDLFLNKTTPPPQPTQQPSNSKFGVDYKFNYPGDKSYVYGYKDGKWYAKNVAKNLEFDLQSNTKFKSSIDNLNKQFANQIKTTQTPQPTPTVQFRPEPTNQNTTDNTYVKPMVINPNFKK